MQLRRKCRRAAAKRARVGVGSGTRRRQRCLRRKACVQAGARRRGILVPAQYVPAQRCPARRCPGRIRARPGPASDPVSDQPRSAGRWGRRMLHPGRQGPPDEGHKAAMHGPRRDRGAPDQARSTPAGRSSAQDPVTAQTAPPGSRTKRTVRSGEDHPGAIARPLRRPIAVTAAVQAREAGRGRRAAPGVALKRQECAAQVAGPGRGKSATVDGGWAPVSAAEWSARDSVVPAPAGGPGGTPRAPSPKCIAPARTVRSATLCASRNSRNRRPGPKQNRRIGPR